MQQEKTVEFACDFINLSKFNGVMSFIKCNKESTNSGRLENGRDWQSCDEHYELVKKEEQERLEFAKKMCESFIFLTTEEALRFVDIVKEKRGRYSEIEQKITDMIRNYVSYNDTGKTIAPSD